MEDQFARAGECQPVDFAAVANPNLGAAREEGLGVDLEAYPTETSNLVT